MDTIYLVSATGLESFTIQASDVSEVWEILLDVHGINPRNVVIEPIANGDSQ